ncbi:anther-specific protein SF2 [Lactuca sativa]|uniref:anther-specific protein SF2 n=1 Tax=Lactuca sativa TaxID=4236 RepID=UPI000CCA2C1F|nr:anther-specific protein SF2 [Lactuca sativa]
MKMSSLVLSGFRILLVVLAISEMITVKGIKYCEKPATYYRGKCVDEKCLNNCKTFESAEKGHCTTGQEKLVCICVYDCAKMNPPPGGWPPPPPKGKTPIII